MMETKWLKRLFLLALALAVPAAAGADTVRIAQIDSANLLIDQNVRLYVSVTDENGEPVPGLEQNRFRVLESADGQRYEEVPRIDSFRPGANRTEGINFLLLIDNSGSMYDTMEGQSTEEESLMRINLAKEAIRTFLGSITNPRDTVGLAAFNTLYTSLADPAGGNARIGSSLDAIQRPAREMAYTELYAGLVQAAEDLSGHGGRRVVIVLSDGENYPYSVYEGQAHPRYGQKVFLHAEPIERAQREGVSIFAINFGRQKDPNLQAIAVETGGAVFDAADREELSAVYQRIRERVRQEYLIGYRATMDPAERKFVRVEYRENGEVRAADRFYYASTVFGLPARRLGWLLVLPFLLAVALWYLLTRLKLEREAARPSLEVLRAQRGAVSTRMFDLGSGQTVIGATAEADLTISGVPTVRQKHATIVYDPAQKGYTLVGEGDLTVNNRPVTRRRLEEGDVINVEGTTIVFHQPPEKGEAGESRRPEARPPESRQPAARPPGQKGSPKGPRRKPEPRRRKPEPRRRKKRS